MSTTGGLVMRDMAKGTCTARAMGSGLTALTTIWGTDKYTGQECSPSLYITGM